MEKRKGRQMVGWSWELCETQEWKEVSGNEQKAGQKV